MGDKASILIVDDDGGMRETLADIMEDSGYCIVSARDGYEAIQKVKEMNFDVILMDIKMPGMNGVETFKEIKKIHPATVVVMMTAYAVEDLVREALREGAYGVLYKPLDIEKMMGLVENVKAGGHILVADDDTKTHAIFKDILEARGYIVSIATSGEEAIRIALENNYDMIFIEMKLSTLSGLDTYLILKSFHPEVVAVMMSAHPRAASESVVEALMRGAHSCLYKPFDVQQVIQLVDGIRSGKRQRGEYDDSS